MAIAALQRGLQSIQETLTTFETTVATLRDAKGFLDKLFAGLEAQLQGVQQLLDAVVDYLPSPLDVPALKGHVPHSDKEEERPADDKAPFAGLAFKNYLLLIVPQITQSFKPLVAMRDGAFDWGATVKNLLFTATLVCVLVYFLFTFRKEVTLVTPARTYGRWMMMICFGTLFGYTVMTRMSYFLERLNYVKTELIEGVLKTIF
jgi:hypothetical protein